MREYYEAEGAALYLRDCRDVLAQLPGESRTSSRQPCAVATRTRWLLLPPPPRHHDPHLVCGRLPCATVCQWVRIYGDVRDGPTPATASWHTTRLR